MKLEEYIMIREIIQLEAWRHVEDTMDGFFDKNEMEEQIEQGICKYSFTLNSKFAKSHFLRVGNYLVKGYVKDHKFSIEINYG